MLRDLFLKTMIDWQNTTGDQPLKLGLRTKWFLGLAAEVGIHDSKAAPRLVYITTRSPLRLMEGTDPTERSFRTGMVCVGKSFRYNGVLIEEVEE